MESSLSKAELEKQVEKVELEKLLLDNNIQNQRENLVKMETLYLIICQITDALMVVHIVVSFIMAHVAGLSMFNDMTIQADDERNRAINEPDSCETNRASLSKTWRAPIGETAEPFLTSIPAMPTLIAALIAGSHQRCANREFRDPESQRP